MVGLEGGQYPDGQDKFLAWWPPGNQLFFSISIFFIFFFLTKGRNTMMVIPSCGYNIGANVLQDKLPYPCLNYVTTTPLSNGVPMMGGRKFFTHKMIWEVAFFFYPKITLFFCFCRKKK